jgi:AcrR family transcriptional regulator
MENTFCFQQEDSAREPRNRILVAAEELFANQGFDGVSIREIANLAQVNSAMIYYYFGNKEDLYRSILERSLAELTNIIERAMQEGRDPVDQITRFVYDYVNFLSQRAKTAQLLLRIVSSEDAHSDEFVKHHLTRNVLAVERILRTGIDSGCFRPFNTRLATISLMGMILWYHLSLPIVSR